LVDAAVSDGADGMAARPQETAAQFKMFAVYQAHQREYLGGMMRAIISKPQSDDVDRTAGQHWMKTRRTLASACCCRHVWRESDVALKKLNVQRLIIASRNR
jgi:hypothetical protein